MTSTSGLPPLASKGVLSISASATIQAPPDKVWTVLMDLPSYKEWNPVMRAPTVIGASGNPLPSQNLTPDVLLKFSLVDPPSLESDSRPHPLIYRVTDVDALNRRISWISWGLHGPGSPWFIAIERWQSVIAADEQGTTSKYEVIEVYRGIASYIFKAFFRKSLQEGFDAMASSLKQRAEQQ